MSKGEYSFQLEKEAQTFLKKSKSNKKEQQEIIELAKNVVEHKSLKEYFSKALMSPLLTSSEEKTLSSQIKSCDAQILSFEKRMLNCEESEKNKIESLKVNKIKLGEHEISFHHVPGHTSDSLIVEFAGHIFTGDILFTGSGGVGRDDLPSGRIYEHWNSLAVLKRFSVDVLVCNGHEPPGTDMQTLAWNRDNNPVLAMTSHDEYHQWQVTTSAGLGSVSKIKTALPANIFAEVPENVPWLQ